jgi:hypothetical protein
VLNRLIAVTFDGPLRPATYESLQILELADNVHDLAADPAPPVATRVAAYPATGAENSSGGTGHLPATLSAKPDQGQCRISRHCHHAQPQEWMPGGDPDCRATVAPLHKGKESLNVHRSSH